MTELEKIVVTSAFTIGGDMFLYAISQLLSKFFIEPVHELTKDDRRSKIQLGVSCARHPYPHHTKYRAV